MVEALTTLLIVLLLTGTIVGGVQSGIKIFREGRFNSEGDLLISSLQNSLGDLLRFSKAVTAGDDPMMENLNYGRGQLVLNDDGQLQFQTDVGNSDLLSKGAYTDLIIRNFEIQYINGVFTGSYTIALEWDETLQKNMTFTFRPLNG